jgi:hypothetical protein
MENKEFLTIQEATDAFVKGDCSPEHFQSEVKRLTENVDTGVRFKVSEKTGTIGVYGLGRYPVSLYRSQWQRFFPEIDKLKKFIAANAEELDLVEKIHTEALEQEQAKRRTKPGDKSNGPVRSLDQEQINRLNAQMNQ